MACEPRSGSSPSVPGWNRRKPLRVKGRRRLVRVLLYAAVAALVWDGVHYAADWFRGTSWPGGTLALAAEEASAAGEEAGPHTTPEARRMVEGSHSPAGHSDPVAPILAGIVIILLVAKIGGDLFERVGMPAVLGELTVGVLLGNLAFLTGRHELDFLRPPPDIDVHQRLTELADIADDETLPPEERQARIAEIRAEVEQQQPYNTGAVLRMLAGIGVILLLFEVGLESTVREMLAVGKSSFLVATLGVVAPMILGYGTGFLLIPEKGWEVHLFLGATLCATSVGITARVLKDLGRSQQPEARIVLGAAVLDDVMGLIVLAVVQGVILKGVLNVDELMLIVGKAVLFLGGAILLGMRLFARPLLKGAALLRGTGLLVAAALVICFVFAWLANLIGLAPIVGAFAAGLILERVHFHELGQREDTELEDALAPISAMLVPIFFVDMGILVDLKSFADPSVWALAGAITLAAIVGKQICSFGVLEKDVNGIAVGVGMIPRGEVGLIFAAQGAALRTHTGEPVISTGTYSAVVVMVMLTTMITPPILKWVLGRSPRVEPPPVA